MMNEYLKQLRECLALLWGHPVPIAVVVVWFAAVVVGGLFIRMGIEKGKGKALVTLATISLLAFLLLVASLVVAPPRSDPGIAALGRIVLWFLPTLLLTLAQLVILGAACLKIGQRILTSKQKTTANQASHATSEPAPGAVSSAREG